MPPRAPARPPRLARLLACVALCLVSAACGGSGDDTPDAAASSGAPSPTSSDSGAEPSPTAGSAPSPPSTPGPSTPGPSDPGPSTPGPSTPGPSDPGSPTSDPSSSSRPARLADRLLAASQLPGFNAAYRWTAGPARPESPSSSFGTCQRFSTLSIGAERALVRGYRPVGGAADGPAADRAGQLVASFPDELTARRAFAVLEAWRSQCADRLARRTRPRVGELQPVSVPGGRAAWYLLTYGPVPGDRDAQYFDAQGMTVVGSRISMVSMVLAGQDYNYEPGREPMVTALQRAAGRLR